MSGSAVPRPERQRDARSFLARASFALVPALVFLALASRRLTAQGLEYDELFQATGTFGWIGLPVSFFAVLSVKGIPLLNMSYAGALKTAAYGLYLRLTGIPFGVLSWRLTGLLFVAIGLVAFFALAPRRIPRLALAVMAALLLTDVQLLLNARHDGGPVALAFLLRMLLLLACIRAIATGGATPVLLAAALVGLGIFEKLSGVALLVPLVVLLLATRTLRTFRHAAAAAFGLALGTLPLVAANAVSWRTSHRLISLALGDGGASVSRGSFQRAFDYVALATGDRLRDLVLGLPTSRIAMVVEACALGLLVGVLVAAALAGRSRWWPAVLGLLVSWAGTGLAVSLLPAKVMAHHLLLGTPFQYLAIGVAAVALTEDVRSGVPWVRALGALSAILLATLIGARLPALVETEESLWAGRASGRFRHDYTAIGEFGAKVGDEAVFVASGWGVATQIFCLANGRPGHVYEPFWSYGGKGDLARIVDAQSRGAFYLVRPEPEIDVTPEATRRIERDADELPGWRAAPLEPTVAALSALRVRKYVRR